MASVTKVVSGNTTTFTITDAQNNAATLTVTTGAVTGNTIAYGGAAVHDDATALIANLLNELQTGLIPGAGAQNLVP
jgi:hypothetical protein